VMEVVVTGCERRRRMAVAGRLHGTLKETVILSVPSAQGLPTQTAFIEYRARHRAPHTQHGRSTGK
jgi:hypothetical protein